MTRHWQMYGNRGDLMDSLLQVNRTNQLPMLLGWLILRPRTPCRQETVLSVDSWQAVFCCRFAFYSPLALSPSTPYPPLPSYLSPIHFSPSPNGRRTRLTLFPFPCMEWQGKEGQKGKPPSVQHRYTLGTPWIFLSSILSVLAGRKSFCSRIITSRFWSWFKKSVPLLDTPYCLSSLSQLPFLRSPHNVYT